MSAVMLGVIDDAIAINPQTNVLKFEVQSDVKAYLEKRRDAPQDFDLRMIDMSAMRPDSNITYLQNRHDVSHFLDHYLPFKEHCLNTKNYSNFDFIEYDDEHAKHMPPLMDKLPQLIGEKFTTLLSRQ